MEFVKPSCGTAMNPRFRTILADRWVTLMSSIDAYPRLKENINVLLPMTSYREP